MSGTDTQIDSNKSYCFDDSHDASQPAQVWFQHSTEGLVLFAVFYTQACRWSKCLGCNLPSKSSSKHINFKKIMQQVDYLFEMPEVKDNYTLIKKFIFSNNGSVLDEETFSSTALMYLMAKINLHLPNLKVLSLETRPEYVEFEELAFLKRALDEADTPTKLELAIGFEAYDDQIRNQFFRKGLSVNLFNNFVEQVSQFDYCIKTYFMQKPVPEITDEEAIQDIKAAIDYLDGLAEKHNSLMNMHLNPTYVAKGTPLENSFKKGLYTPPKLIDVVRAALHGEGKNISIFIGLYDEGLSVEGGSFVRPGEEALVEKLEMFNQTQDYSILKQVLKCAQ